MTDDCGLVPYLPKAKKIEPKPRTPLWTMRRGADQLRFEMLFHEDGAAELQIFRNDHFLYSWRQADRAAATLIAEQSRGDYEAKGWAMEP